MGTGTFDKWVNNRRIAVADRIYGELAKSQDGQIQILNAAAEHDTVAADYLFNRLKPIITKAFWQYYLGPDRSKHASRIHAGADQDFASMAYEMLLGASTPSPYATFDAKKFNEKADLIKQFGYYLYRYLQNEAFKMIRADKIGGIGGNLKSDEDVSVVGYENHFENDTATAEEDHSTAIDTKQTLKAFLQYLRKNFPKYYNIFKHKLRDPNLSIDALAQLTGVSDVSVRTYLKNIKELYEDFIN